jgi:hypothetical protein
VDILYIIIGKDKIMFMKIIYIYGLYEVGKEDKIRYVGKTNNPKTRIYTHLKRTNVNQEKVKWIQNVLNNGFEIKMNILEECTEHNWREREIYWISRFENLFNKRSGGQCGKLYSITYQECKDWVKENCVGIDTVEKWKKMEKPEFIPKYPTRVFSEFTTWGDFLGTNRKHNIEYSKNYLSYIDAIEYIKNMNIKSGADWIKKYKLGHIPTELFPKKPQRYYQKRGWASWGHFLSTGRVQNGMKEFITFDECKEFAKSNNINSKSEWLKIKKPFNVPSLPSVKYKKEWKSWIDFFGRDTKIKRIYLSLEDLKILLKSNSVETIRQYKIFCKGRTKEFKIPTHPEYHYDDWMGWNYLFN